MRIQGRYDDSENKKKTINLRHNEETIKGLGGAFSVYEKGREG